MRRTDNYQILLTGKQYYRNKKASFIEAFFIKKKGGGDYKPNRPFKWEPQKDSQGTELW